MRLTSKSKGLSMVTMRLNKISRLMGDNKYVPLIIKSDDADPIKYYSKSAAARHCGVTKQTLDYAHKHRCTRIVRRKGVVKEFRITWL